MMRRPVYVEDLETLRLVDLQALSDNMGLNLSKNMNKDKMIDVLTIELRNAGPQYLSKGTNQKSPRGKQSNAVDLGRYKQEFEQYAKQLIAEVDRQPPQNGQKRGSGSFQGYRSQWQYIVSQVSHWAGERGINMSASQVAKAIDPYYKGTGNRSRSKSPSRNNQYRDTNRNANRNSGTYNSYNYSNAGSRVNENDLRQFVNNFGLQQNGYSEFRSQWQALISAVSKRYGLNAAEAAKVLDPYYISQKEKYPTGRGNLSPRSQYRNTNGNRNSGNYTNSLANMTLKGFPKPSTVNGRYY